MDDLLTAAEAAKLLHLHVKRVQILARTGRLPAVRTGRKWLFPRRQLLEALRPAGGVPLDTAVSERVVPVEISARNQLRGIVERLVYDGLMAEVQVRIGDQSLVSLITRSSAERLGLAVGREVLAVIKATEVMIARSDGR